MAQRAKREDCKFDPNPIRPPDYIAADVLALRAVFFGSPTPEQQKAAYRFLMEDICEMNKLPWRKDSSMQDVCIGKQAAGYTTAWFAEKAPIDTKLSTPERDAKIAARESFNKEDEK